MLINDVRYFKPQVITALFRANKLISKTEAVKTLTPVQSDTGGGFQCYTFAVLYEDFRTQRHAPDHVQLKIGNAEAIQARREVSFYRQIASPMLKQRKNTSFYFPKSYDAYIDNTTHEFHLILDGCSPDFKPANNNMPPTSRHREQLIDTLANLHAYYWDHPLIGEFHAQPTDTMFTERLVQLQQKFDSLNQSVGTYLDRKHITVLEKIAAIIPEKRKIRLLSGQDLTVIHGRLHPENILYSNRETAIINWQHWRVGFGVDDLAIMIPLNWTDDLRIFQELPLLKRYYSILTENRVTNYSWADLEYDYRASLANIIADMLLAWTLDEHTRGHWRIMEKALDRFIELQGESILI